MKLCGLPDTSIKESRERIKVAIKNSRLEFPSKKFLINLAPADIKKEGSSFDLAIAVGILIATGSIYKKQNKDLEKTIFIGELSLDGKVNKVNGILPMCIEAYNLGINKVIIPKENAKEAAAVKNLEVIAVNNLIELVKYLNDEINIEVEKINTDEILKNSNKYKFDYSEVKGQENIKRALEIAAARRT